MLIDDQVAKYSWSSVEKDDTFDMIFRFSTSSCVTVAGYSEPESSTTTTSPATASFLFSCWIIPNINVGYQKITAFTKRLRTETNSAKLHVY
jgi:hypothetical protein